MKIAILYTGEVRTLMNTIDLFKQNVVLNENYHVFPVIQTNEENTIELFMKEKLGDNMKSYFHFNKTDKYWQLIREYNLNNMHLSNNWTNYLRNSGSMVEYIQMYLAYLSMANYENTNNTKYDFVIRFRTDTVMKDILNFDWINYDNIKIREILYEIKNNYNLESIVSREAISILMNTIYFQNRMKYIPTYEIDITQKTEKIFSNFNFEINKKDVYFEDVFVERLNHYIKKGDYLIGFRVNVIYFAQRHVFDKINILGLYYGKYKYLKDDYWFNAECQLKQICLDNEIDVYNSTTDLEGKSLYEYNKCNYFDESNNLLNKSYSFFIMREM
jgi:hypothetical protein